MTLVNLCFYKFHNFLLDNHTIFVRCENIIKCSELFFLCC